MRLLVVGATGLIGSAVTARLLSEGHEVTGIARATAEAARRFPRGRWLSLDLAQLVQPDGWLPHLDGIDAVVNCAGLLQEGPGESLRDIHVEAVAALATACARQGVRRFVHLSAIGIERETPSAFSRTKLQGDRAIMGLDLDWVVLRPSVVVGRQAYGGSALFRGLAALPVLPAMPDTGLLQLVQLDDLVETILRLLPPSAPSRVTLELAGPERLSFVQIVQAYRRWLGWRPAADCWGRC